MVWAGLRVLVFLFVPPVGGCDHSFVSEKPLFGGAFPCLDTGGGRCYSRDMEKMTAGKVNDDHIGKYVELYWKTKTENIPREHGHGMLINYRKRGNEIDFIFAGNFDHVTVRQTDIMQVFNRESGGIVS